MRSVISLLICGIVLMSGVYCKKETKLGSVPDVGRLAGDSDFVGFYREVLRYSEKIGAIGQVEKFSMLIDQPSAFGVAAKLNFDRMSLAYPPSEERELLRMGARIIEKYNLTGMKNEQLRELFATASLHIETISDWPGLRLQKRCYDDLIRKQTRCDRNMTLAVAVTYASAGAAMFFSGGLAAPAITVSAMIIIAGAWVEHSFCIDDSLKDYNDCLIP